MKNFVVIFLFLICAITSIQASDKPHITLKGKSKSDVIISHEAAMSSPFLRQKIEKGEISLLYYNTENTTLKHIKEYTIRRYQIDLISQNKLGFHNADPKEELSTYLNRLSINELVTVTQFVYSFFPTEEIPIGLLDVWTNKIKHEKYNDEQLGIQQMNDLLGEKGPVIFQAYADNNPPLLEEEQNSKPNTSSSNNEHNESKKESWWKNWNEFNNFRQYIFKAYNKISFDKKWRQKITNEQIITSIILVGCAAFIIYRWKNPYPNIFI